MTGGPEGLLLLDKPEGPTSHDIVAHVRRVLRQPRVGHAGTLDPMASGLLPLVLGRATRLVRFLPHSPKVYAGRFVLGISTSTDDLQGEATAQHEGPIPTEDDVVEAAKGLLGTQMQVPPRVAARRIGGERMYRLARRGEAFDAPPSEVEIFRFDLVPAGGPESWAFETAVSGGTYVRALVRDLGRLLGCGAALAALRRTAIGPMTVGDSAPVPLAGDPGAREALGARILPLEAIPLIPAVLRLADAESVSRFLSGVALRRPAPDVADGDVRVLDVGGCLLGIGEMNAGVLRPRVVLPRP